MTPEVLAIAEAQAAKDRDILAALLRDGHVMRSEDRHGGSMTARPSGRAFIADIEQRAFPVRKINLAIRPKRKRR